MGLGLAPDLVAPALERRVGLDELVSLTIRQGDLCLPQGLLDPVRQLRVALFLQRRRAGLAEARDVFESGLVRETSRRLEEREKDLKAREEAATATEESIAARVEDLVAKRIEVLGSQARRDAQEAVSADVEVLKEQLSGAKAKLKEANDAELQLRKAKAALEGEREALDLEVARRLDEERAEIRDVLRCDPKPPTRLMNSS